MCQAFHSRFQLWNTPSVASLLRLCAAPPAHYFVTFVLVSMPMSFKKSTHACTCTCMSGATAPEEIFAQHNKPHIFISTYIMNYSCQWQLLEVGADTRFLLARGFAVGILLPIMLIVQGVSWPNASNVLFSPWMHTWMCEQPVYNTGQCLRQCRGLAQSQSHRL